MGERREFVQVSVPREVKELLEQLREKYADAYGIKPRVYEVVLLGLKLLKEDLERRLRE